jgi:hypothetical protein
MAALSFPVSLATFRGLFPEFATAPDALAQSRLDQAAVQVDPAVWGARAGEGQVYLSAHLLAIAPGGIFARLQSEKGQSTYGTYYDRMVIQVACLRCRVI